MRARLKIWSNISGQTYTAGPKSIRSLNEAWSFPTSSTPFGRFVGAASVVERASVEQKGFLGHLGRDRVLVLQLLAISELVASRNDTSCTVRFGEVSNGSAVERRPIGPR